MTQHSVQGQKFMLGVTILPPPLPEMTFMERLAERLGDPKKVMRACLRLQLGVAVFGLVYAVAWTFLIGQAVTHALQLSRVEVLVFSMAWVPLLGVNVALSAVHYGAFCVQIKQARQMAELAESTFFQTVAACVSDTIARWEATQERPEKPTLQ